MENYWVQAVFGRARLRTNSTSRFSSLISARATSATSRVSSSAWTSSTRRSRTSCGLMSCPGWRRGCANTRDGAGCPPLGFPRSGRRGVGAAAHCCSVESGRVRPSPAPGRFVDRGSCGLVASAAVRPSYGPEYIHWPHRSKCKAWRRRRGLPASRGSAQAARAWRAAPSGRLVEEIHGVSLRDRSTVRNSVKHYTTHLEDSLGRLWWYFTGSKMSNRWTQFAFGG